MSAVTQAINSHALLASIDRDMAAVAQIIRRQLQSDVPLVNRIGEQLVAAGGKRIRPALVLLFANAFGYRGTHHHTLAAVVEFIHTATLLHDDVIDESSLRRGQPTANALFGNAAAVLVGDFLYSRAFQMMVSVDDMQVMRILADAANVIAEGEVMQLMHLRDSEITEERYFQVIHAKTAKLFEAAATIGALLAGAPEPAIASAAEYGRALGRAFQLADDMLDYIGNAQEIGKNLGDDLREGKVTLPLIRLLQVGTEGQRQLAREGIRKGNLSRFDNILDAIHASGSLTYARQAAESAALAANAALASLPGSQFKETLLQLPAFAVGRNH